MKKTSDIFKRVLSIISSFVIVFLGINFPMVSEDAAAKDETTAYVREMELLINEARVENGLKPVYIVPYLCEVAVERCNESAVLWSKDHMRPNGTKFHTIIDKEIAPWWSVYEDTGAGSENPEIIFNAWKNSSKHWKALLNEEVTHMGVGLAYVEGSDYGWYWTVILMNTSKNEPFDGQYIPQRYEIIPASCGDINGDGFVDSFDYILLVKYIEGEAYLNDLQIESADCLKDGSITIADAATLQKYILHKIDQIPDSLF